VVLPLFWFALKVFCFIFVYVWLRGTLPRFRYDQLMAFGWKFLMPVALGNVILTSFVIVAWPALSRFWS
jgi:NADH-quinone oxidoreductase subunit H